LSNGLLRALATSAARKHTKLWSNYGPVVVSEYAKTAFREPPASLSRQRPRIRVRSLIFPPCSGSVHCLIDEPLLLATAGPNCGGIMLETRAMRAGPVHPQLRLAPCLRLITKSWVTSKRAVHRYNRRSVENGDAPFPAGREAVRMFL
jgi:hypothetical protein